LGDALAGCEDRPGGCGGEWTGDSKDPVLGGQVMAGQVIAGHVPSVVAFMKAAPVVESKMGIGSVLFKVAWKKSDRGVYAYFREGKQERLLKAGYGDYMDRAAEMSAADDTIVGDPQSVRLNEIFGKQKTSKGRDGRLAKSFVAEMVVKGVSYKGTLLNIRKSKSRDDIYKGDFTADVFTAFNMNKQIDGNDIIKGELFKEFRVGGVGGVGFISGV
jgi:hypothetical protein